MTQPDYILTISKDQLAEMPVSTYPGKITLVDKPSVARAALRALSREKVVGFDTETKPSFRKGSRHKVALMQIATADRCFLFRLNIIGIGAGLKKFLENPDILKIGLSVHDDFNAIRRTEEFEPQGFVDLQSMVRDFEIADISLQKIYAIIFGERISKNQRLTNWEADDLTEAQQAYAALDAWACLKIYNVLKEGRFDYLHSPYRHHPDPEALIPVPKSLSTPTKEVVKKQGDELAQKEMENKPKRRPHHRKRKKKSAEDSGDTNQL